MSTECSSEPSPVAFCLISRASRRSPAQRVRREEEEQGSERSFRRQAETETSGLKVNWPEGPREGGLGHCDDEPPWAKELAARRRRNSLRKTIGAARRVVAPYRRDLRSGRPHGAAPTKRKSIPNRGGEVIIRRFPRNVCPRFWEPAILKCSAEVNSACAKVLPAAKRLYGASAPPHLRWGPGRNAGRHGCFVGTDSALTPKLP